MHSHRGRSIGCLVLAVASALVLSGCKGESTDTEATRPAGTVSPGSPAVLTTELALPDIDIVELPFALQTKIGAARREARRSPNDPIKLADLAAVCYVHGFPHVALICFERAAQVEPEQPQRFLWWYYVGLTREKLNQPVEALAAYERALAQAPDRPDKQALALIRAGVLLIDKDLARAAEKFRRVLEVEGDPNRVAAHFGLGVCARTLGRTEEAIAHFRAALEEAPEFGPAHGALADLLASLGQTEEAQLHQDRAVDTDKPIQPLSDPAKSSLLRLGLNVPTLLAGAIEVAQRGRFGDAEEMVRAAMDIDPAGVDAHNIHGLILGMQGKMDEAIRAFEYVLGTAKGRDSLPPKLNLAYMRMQRQELEQAERLIREILDQDPTYADGLRLFCTLATLQRDPGRALPVLDAALAAAPNDALMHHQVGILLLELNRHSEAKAALLKAVALRPGLAVARIPLGALLFQENDTEGARHQWTESVRLDPRLIHARIGLVGVYKRERAWDKIEPILREGLQILPHSPDLANHLAWHLATCPDPRYRNPAEAVELALKACAATNYQDAMAIDTLATAYAAAGRFDEARHWIDKAIDLVRAAGSQRHWQEYNHRRSLFEADRPYFEEE